MRPLVSQANEKGKPGAAAAGELESGGLSIGDIFRTIARRWLFIVSCVIVCTGLSYLYARSLTRIYEAVGTIRIDPNRSGSIGLASIEGKGMPNDDEMGTDIEIFKSDSVAVETLNTLSDGDFRRFAGGPRSQLAFSADTVTLTPSQEALLRQIKDRLSAKQVGSTQLISVSYRNPDPQMAATIANAAMTAYMKVSFDNQYTSVKQVRTWVYTQMEDLHNRALLMQNKLTEFQEKNNILATSESSNTTIDALRMISDDLTKARADRIVREAQLRAAESGQPEVVAAIFPSATMTVLESQRAVLTGQITQLSSKFDMNYPPLQDAHLALDKINSDFAHELALIRSRVKQDYDTALTVENILQGQYNGQLSKAYALNRQEATYGVLLSESKSARDLYDALERGLQQAGISAGLSAVNSMLVDRARAPYVPVEPKKKVIVGFGFMLGLFCGLGAAFLRDLITDTAKSEEQLENALGAYVLAAVPNISGTAKTSAKTDAPEIKESVPAQMVAFLTPLSRAAEAFRNLRNGLLLSGDTLKTILVTSSIAGEGKSTVAANLAVVLAQRGARVLLVDADLRRPRIHDLFGLENLHGVSDLILGEEIEDPAQSPLASLPNLSVITAGKRVTLPAEALSSTRLYHLLEKWEQTYDYLVIDSAPLLIVSDSLPLAKWVDAALLVVRYNSVSMAGLRRVRTVLAQAQTTVTGLVLNDLPLKNTSYGNYQENYGYYE